MTILLTFNTQIIGTWVTWFPTQTEPDLLLKIVQVE